MSPTALQRLSIFLSVIVLGAAGLLFWTMLHMSAASLAFVNTISQFILVIMGAAVVARETFPKRHPWLTIGAFAVVGSIGMFASIQQGRESAKETAEAQLQATEASNRLHDSMDRLGKQNGDL